MNCNTETCCAKHYIFLTQWKPLGHSGQRQGNRPGVASAVAALALLLLVFVAAAILPGKLLTFTCGREGSYHHMMGITYTALGTQLLLSTRLVLSKLFG